LVTGPRGVARVEIGFHQLLHGSPVPPGAPSHQYPPRKMISHGKPLSMAIMRLPRFLPSTSSHLHPQEDDQLWEFASLAAGAAGLFTPLSVAYIMVNIVNIVNI